MSVDLADGRGTSFPLQDRGNRLTSPHNGDSSPPPRHIRLASRALQDSVSKPIRLRESRGNKSGYHSSLTQLLVYEEHEVQAVRELLQQTVERLDAETQRANASEMHTLEIVQRFRALDEARLLAQRDAERANKELELYKIELNRAQQEIFRAQEVLDVVEEQKREAEESAARARARARKFREERLVDIAIEEGRRLGLQEGLARGRGIGYDEGMSVNRGAQRGRFVEEFHDDTDEEEVVYEETTSYRNPSPPDQRQPQSQPQPQPEPQLQQQEPDPRARDRDTHRRSVPSRIMQRLRSRSGDKTEDSVNPHVKVNRNAPDTALHAPTLPFPTITTPINVPSPSHAPHPTPHPSFSSTARFQAQSPVQPEARRKRSISTSSPIPTPIPVRTLNSAPSPRLRDSVIPTDILIPSMDDDDYIALPPPHELGPYPPSPGAHSLPSLPDTEAVRRSRSREFPKTPSQAPVPIPAPAPTRDQSQRGTRGHSSRSHRTSPDSQGSSSVLSHYDLVRGPSSQYRRGEEGFGLSPIAEVKSQHPSPGDGHGSRFYASRSTPLYYSREGDLGRSGAISRSGRGSFRDQYRPSSGGRQSDHDHDYLPRRPGSSSEVKMPTPIGQHADLAGLEERARHVYTRPRAHSDDSDSEGRSQRREVSRVSSNTTVPGITIEPPSPNSHSLSSSSAETVIRPHLLSPEHAHHILPPTDEMPTTPETIAVIDTPAALPPIDPSDFIPSSRGPFPLGFVPTGFVTIPPFPNGVVPDISGSGTKTLPDPTGTPSDDYFNGGKSHRNYTIPAPIAQPSPRSGLTPGVTGGSLLDRPASRAASSQAQNRYRTPPEEDMYISGRRSRASTSSRSKPRYEVAPTPPGFTYPDPPVSRTNSRAAGDVTRARSYTPHPTRRSSSPDSSSTKSAPLNRPLSIFTDHGLPIRTDSRGAGRANQRSAYTHVDTFRAIDPTYANTVANAGMRTITPHNEGYHREETPPLQMRYGTAAGSRSATSGDKGKQRARAASVASASDED